MSKHAEVFHTTTNPCPFWCTEPTGHGYDSITPDDDLSRIHVGKLGGPVVVHWRINNGVRDYEVNVDIASMEIVTSDEKQLEITPATLSMDYQEGSEFDSAQARQLAAALLDAADRFDEITGAS
jgi:hypothetical protein